MLHCDRSLISISPLCRAEQPSLGAQLGEAEPHGPAAQPHGPAEPPGAAEPRRPAQPRGPASTSTAPPATGTREQVFHFLNGLFFSLYISLESGRYFYGGFYLWCFTYQPIYHV